MSEKEIPSSPLPGIDKQNPSLDTNTNKGEEIFRDIYEKSAWNPEFQKVLELLKSQITWALLGTKWADIRDFLSNPEVFSNNPVQYRQLFEVIGWEIDLQSLKKISRSIAKQYIEYKESNLQKKISWNNQEATVAEQKATVAEQKATVAEQKATVAKQEEIVAKQEEIVAKQEEIVVKEELNDKLKEITERRKSVENIQSIISPEWNKKVEQYVQENMDSPIFSQGDLANDIKNQWENANEFKRSYLKASFILANKIEIKQDLQKNIEKAPPEKKAEYAQKLETFNTEILRLEGMNIMRPISVKWWISDLPPTRATETAIAQAEKYEKSHTVYRDGTSLYFVNKDNPKDIKKIEIFADRAVLTVSVGWLSLSRDMTLLSREDAEKRREQRKSEEEWIKLQKNVADESRKVEFIKSDDIPDDLSQKTEIISPYNNARKAYDQAKNPTEKLEFLRVLKRENEKFEIARRWAITPENMNDTKMVNLEGRLVNEKYGLERLERVLEEYISNMVKFDTMKKEGGEITENYEWWENQAKTILWDLTSDSYWYNGLSQENFDRLISTLKEKSGNGLWKDGFAYDNPISQRNQLLELKNIANMRAWEKTDTGNLRVGWKNIQNELQISESPLSKIWSSPNPQALWNWAYEKKWEQIIGKPTETK